ncbi:hypothetical protein IVA95_19070 [Bradyrhizobium sp. 157]|uniref:hypothetical protein n=1 Tax=Bradyrhizobium sp. 157 TaxID=2782631 RepID=UPI001FF9EB9A|nr:hypothetical protein [Bradyrhizobium sp. 157]MCK1639639.1 hypothetical protein [Bradyrhizobium sp. 157]
MAPFFPSPWAPASSAYSISGLWLTQIALMMLPAGKAEGNSRGPAYGDNIKVLRQEMCVQQAQKRTSILYVHAEPRRHPLVCGICCEVSKTVLNIVHRHHRGRRFAAATAARGQRGGRGRLHGGNEN